MMTNKLGSSAESVGKYLLNRGVAPKPLGLPHPRREAGVRSSNPC